MPAPDRARNADLRSYREFVAQKHELIRDELRAADTRVPCRSRLLPRVVVSTCGKGCLWESPVLHAVGKSLFFSEGGDDGADGDTGRVAGADVAVDLDAKTAPPESNIQGFRVVHFLHCFG